MSDFRLGTIPSSSILHIYSLRESILFDPSYQRMSDVWPLYKRQLLIDSIINGYDVPKLYFHEFFPAKEINGRKYKYAIVDGKQRLETIVSFIEGKFPLDSDMEFIADPSIKLGGLTYAELARAFPDIKTRFDGFVLPIISILTDETELIEDMFSRLNEAVPLNAPEKRNALGGAIPQAVRDLATQRFFQSKLPFNNRRYRHFDLATKFLYTTSRGQLVDTKKIHLDEFVISYRDKGLSEVADLSKATKRNLAAMSKVFIDQDWLLRSVGTVLIYYFLFVDAAERGWVDSITRSKFEDFEKIRNNNRDNAEKNKKVVFSLLEYDRLTQSPNDGTALRYRYAVLRQYIGPAKGRPEIPDDE